MTAPVTQPVTWTGAGWALREDFLGAQPRPAVALLVLLGELSEPTFAVRVCSVCSAVLGVKVGTPGKTHGMCPACDEQAQEQARQYFANQPSKATE